MMTGGKTMRRASDLLGLPVFDSSQDQQIGTVREMLVDLPQGRLVALVMPEKVLVEPGLIPVDHRLNIGTEEVRLLDKNTVIHGDKAENIRQGKLTLERVRKLTVITRSGNRLGNVEDLIMDGCHVFALELSDGLIQDIFQGRETINLPQEANFEDENIVVPDGTQCYPQDQSQGGSWTHDQGF